MEKKLRKNQNILAISGLAVIAFGLWSILKTVVSILLIKGDDGKSLLSDPEGLKILSVVLIAVGIVMLIEFGLRVYIGLSARAESHGKKKTVLYLILVIPLIIYSGFGVAGLFRTGFTEDILNTIVSILVELTSLFALVELFIRGIRVKQLKKQIEKETQAAEEKH